MFIQAYNSTASVKTQGNVSRQTEIGAQQLPEGTAMSVRIGFEVKRYRLESSSIDRTRSGPDMFVGIVVGALAHHARLVGTERVL